MKKTICSVLVILSLLLGMASCGEKAGTVPEDTAVTSESAATVTETETSGGRAAYSDGLPAFDFKGAGFDICGYQSAFLTYIHGETLSDKATGDLINDAIYTRRVKLEERFNVAFSEIFSTNNLRVAALAGDDKYELFMAGDGGVIEFACEELLVPFDAFEYVDLEQPWWAKSINDMITFNGKLYFAFSDLTLSMYDLTHVITFNKVMAENYKLENIYELVKGGKWTFDKFGELAESAVADLNGDNVFDTKDQYGFTSMGKHVLPNFWMGAGERTVELGKDGFPYFSVKSSTRFTDVFEKIYEQTYDNKSWYPNNDDGDKDLIFEHGQALFDAHDFYSLESLRGNEIDFGILPYPKYDEKQEEYYSRIEGGSRIIAVPVTNKAVEMTGVILEAMSCEAGRAIVPMYFEVVLKTKFTRDDESAEMLDIIFANRVYDLGDSIWCSTIRDGIMRTLFTKNDRNLASALASVEQTINAKVDAVKASAAYK